MKKSVPQIVEENIERAKQNGKADFKLTMKYGETSSLGKVIKTKEQAALFMKLLKSL